MFLWGRERPQRSQRSHVTAFPSHHPSGVEPVKISQRKSANFSPNVVWASFQKGGRNWGKEIDGAGEVAPILALRSLI